jgi:hypothetical protein
MRPHLSHNIHNSNHRTRRAVQSTFAPNAKQGLHFTLFISLARLIKKLMRNPMSGFTNGFRIHE